MKVKTRFAPSPTGQLHLGNIRTALYAWLFSKANNGTFILRIEDSDQERSCSYSVKEIIKNISWLGLNWEEGPFFQTDRINRYHEIMQKMLSNGSAYKCFCSKRRIEKIRMEQISKGEKPRYDGFCRKIYENHRDPFVVRFKSPTSGITSFVDMIYGPIKFKNQELDDLIICRTNGTFTYNFCSVVDDYDMKITHVIRGEEHINNTPKQINIFRSLNAEIPQYAHVPMILGEDRKRLSKRNCSKSIKEYREDGFLPEALLNYLIRLGWSFGNKEIFSVDEMKELFNLSSVKKASCIFNEKKLFWINKHYIKNLETIEIKKRLNWYLEKEKIDVRTGPPITSVIELLSKRCKTLREMAINCKYFYEDFELTNSVITERYLPSSSFSPLLLIRNKIKEIHIWTLENIRKMIKESIEFFNLEREEVNMFLRVSITGTNRSPSIDHIIYLIGKNHCVRRIDSSLSFIKKNKGIDKDVWKHLKGSLAE